MLRRLECRQIANETAKALVDRGLGKFSCLAGIGSHGQGFITAAKEANRVISLDGCAAKCAYKTLGHAGIEPTLQVVVTDIGMKKDYDNLNPSQEEVNRVADTVQNRL
jgi:uncharacterized metal-binding protein